MVEDEEAKLAGKDWESGKAVEEGVVGVEGGDEGEDGRVGGHDVDAREAVGGGGEGGFVGEEGEEVGDGVGVAGG